ncbi:MAG: Mrp/NBP35 family ATP-binding protein [Deltaproteobacteria bacterium]|nr:Mrp/NBP35 family ATP-binding protein [Deltaproteobacteria bacterium]
MAQQGQNGGGCGGSRAAMDLQDKLIESSLGRIKHKLLVMSGKGGVGKSSIAANIAVALSRKGFKTGLLDVDLHGPSIAKIMGIDSLLDVTPQNLIIPYTFTQNLKVVSMQALMPEADHAVIWRGPAKHGVIRQFIADVMWDDLDYLVIDAPPGTGDEPLTVAQLIGDAEAVIVCTPQEVACADVRKSIHFCKKMNMKIAGLVENMGSFPCPHCGEKIALFGDAEGGKRTANEADIPFLGSIPFDLAVVKACDTGRPASNEATPTPFAEALNGVVDKITQGA